MAFVGGCIFSVHACLFVCPILAGKDAQQVPPILDKIWLVPISNRQAKAADRGDLFPSPSSWPFSWCCWIIATLDERTKHLATSADIDKAKNYMLATGLGAVITVAMSVSVIW